MLTNNDLNGDIAYHADMLRNLADNQAVRYSTDRAARIQEHAEWIVRLNAIRTHQEAVS